jgi:hypothetical protein
MAEVALRLLATANFCPGFKEEPGRLACREDAMRLVNRDVAARPVTGTQASPRAFYPPRALTRCRRSSTWPRTRSTRSSRRGLGMPRPLAGRSRQAPRAGCRVVVLRRQRSCRYGNRRMARPLTQRRLPPTRTENELSTTSRVTTLSR